MRDTTRLERASMVVQGERAELRLDGGRITINKQTATQDRPTSVSVPIGQIRGATVDKPSRGQRGWFHLAVVGGSVLPPTELAASADPYTFPIAGREVSAARRLARLVADHVRHRGLPPESPADQLRTSSGVSIAAGPPTTDQHPAHPTGDGPHPPPPPPPVEPRRGQPPRSEPAGNVVPGRAAADNGEVTAELDLYLCELADLHRAGVLTDDEYERARVRVASAGHHDHP